MPNLLHRISFDKLSNHLPPRPGNNKNNTSSSMPNFRLTTKLRSFGRSHSFSTRKNDKDNIMVDEAVRVVEDRQEEAETMTRVGVWTS